MEFVRMDSDKALRMVVSSQASWQETSADKGSQESLEACKGVLNQYTE
ncbi:hypothetical protein MASR2M48_16940 [Spirochaetota bacterium]